MDTSSKRLNDKEPMAKLLKITKRRQEIIDTLFASIDDISNLSDEFILSIPCDIIHNMVDEENTERIIDRVFNYYRRVGFPYYSQDDAVLLKEHKKFNKFDVNRLVLDNNELNQAMLGLSFTNAFFPNMWSVRCKNQKTPMEVFNDDALLKLAIRKRIRMSDSKLAPFNIRKSIKLFSGAQAVSGFRPTIAKCLVGLLFPNGEKISVLDPCMGWGGRMYGFSQSDQVEKYVGFDVATETVMGLWELRNKLRRLNLLNDTDIAIYQHPFEDARDIVMEYTPFDLVMTSPPYFDIEKYSDDEDQSYRKYATYTEWVDGFLKPSIILSHHALRSGGILALNVGYGELYDDTYAIIEEVFGSVETVYNMRLSRLCGKGVDKSVQKFKHEPIIIARKET